MIKVLDNLNADFTSVTDLIPNKYIFAYDGDNNNIDDGGNDMYDDGNFLNTNLSSKIPYSDNVVTNGSAFFGAGTNYFTSHLDGLFVMVADLNAITNFSISGGNGADGGGNVDGDVLTSTVNGIAYTGFLKRVYNAGDPSINQLMIIENDDNASHSFSTDSDNTQQVLSGIAGVTRVYYLLYAGDNGAYIDNTAAQAIMEQFVKVIGGGTNVFLPEWITLDAYDGSVVPATTQTVGYTLDLTAYPDGNYTANILIVSNDPNQSVVTIPVHINLGAVVVQNPIADVLVNEGFGTRDVNITNVFIDANGDALTFSTGTSNAAIATTSITGANLTVTEHGTGTITVSVRAEDTNSNVVFEDFTVRINDIPSIANPISDKNLLKGFGTSTVDVSSVFADSDTQDNLALTVGNSNDAVVTVSISAGLITLTETGLGTSTVTLTVNDGSGGSAQETFVVTVDKIAATVVLTNTETTFDGTAKSVTATTTPAGLTVNIVYILNGSAVTTPTNAGIYEVTATINDGTYQGSTTGALTIGKANQIITFAALPGVLNSVESLTLTATSSSALSVSFTVVSGPASVSGNTLALSGEIGTVVISATQVGNENFIAAPAIERNLVVGQDPILSTDDALEASVETFPVPASDFVTIKTGTHKIIRLLVIDAFGRTLHAVEPQQNEYQLNVKSYPQGVFTVKITSEKGIVTRRIQVTR
jgi:hypothetical protein